MIVQFLSRQQKLAAWLMLMVFYADMLVAADVMLSRPVGIKGFVHTNKSFNGADTRGSMGLPEYENIDKEKEPRNAPKQITTHSSSKRINSGNIGGPGQPEMQAFQSVNANNLVDLFSGDFSYNIPLMDVGGYPLGLSYRSGVTMDQEASWVGLGWNINPGTIMRNVRGIPDDFNGTEKIKKELNIRKNWTAGITAAFKPELFGFTLPKLSSSLGIFYNNYNGIGFELGADATFNLGPKSINGIKTDKKDSTKLDTSYVSRFSPNIAFSLNSQQGLFANAGMAYRMAQQGELTKGEGKVSLGYSSRSGLQDLQLDAQKFKYKVDQDLGTSSQQIDRGGRVNISFAKTNYTPTISIPFTSYSFSLTLKYGGEVYAYHPLGSLKGYYSQQFIQKDDKVLSLPAYGYMNYEKGNRDENGLLDFNREKDIPYRTQTPHSSIPIYTYDTYSISGEGIGGSFRPYRGDVGYMRDHNIKTKSGSGGLGIDLGGGNLAHFGADLNFNYSTVSNSAWQSGNFMERRVAFNGQDSVYEPVYFRNPAEQTTNTQDYYDKMGGDDVVRVGIAGPKISAYATQQFKRFDEQKYMGAVTVGSKLIKEKRDKRSQVISYLTANEAQRVGLDSIIKSYPINTFPKGKCDSSFERIKRNDGVDGLRKPNHLSEISVLNADGRRYIYGIPAYNTSQREVTFSVSKYSDGSNATGLVTYNPGSDNTRDFNTNGKENYYSSDSTPGYAHSFLLTGLLSPDYVDITGDGITEDDNGDAVRFNYSRMKWYIGQKATTNYKWRAPYEYAKATFSESLKTDRNDDKGSYVYGEKEIWYMNSIESKTMIATFVLDDAPRQDGYGVIDENGGRNLNLGLKRLKQINLYSKADYFKNPSKARPIKTVNFAYSYSLCNGTPSSNNTGKLTLDSVWFTYNGNNRSSRNKYVFKYSSNNPTYNNKSYDRWGNYKPNTDNPNSVTNAEFPYATQDKVKSDANVVAWNLAQIKLPSGAKMDITYESDDYGYVQNKRAMNMYKIAAMGPTVNFATASNQMYAPGADHRFLFIRVPTIVNNKTDLLQQYFEGVNKLYCRVSVKMPYNAGYEMVPFYSEFDSCGIVSGSNNLIWIALKEFGKNQTAPTIAALQFLRQNLPGLAYPGSDVSDDAGPRAAIQAILGMGAQFKDAVIGFNSSKRKSSICKIFDSTKSYIRLDNPTMNKLGGGYRVKKIVISDNWFNMTGQKESYYGQEYDYTTTKSIVYDSSGFVRTKTIRISSGVATYEPNIGNEENPFRQPIEFQENVSLAPTDYFYSEYPYCESLYPAASVGYGKVTVSSINKRNIKSFNGWEESEFYTTADFPTFTDYTNFDAESRKRYSRKFSLLNSVSIKRTTLSQGFKIELNDMNGKLKAQRSYAANDSLRPVSYTLNFYKTQQSNTHGTYLSNSVQVVDSANGKINQNGTVGKDVELMMDFREQQTLSTGVSLNINSETFILFIFPVVIPPFFPVTSLEDNKYRSAVTVKIIQRYGILDSVLHYEKGSLVSTKNVLYDSETGDVLLTRTQNEFNDPIYNFNYPAHWAYSGLEPAYRNIGATFSNINIAAGRIVSNGVYRSVESYLESGDELLVVTPGATQLNAGYCSLPALSYRAANARKLWVVDVSKTSNAGGKQLYIMDRFGNPFTGFGTTIKIIRSGKRNMASSSVGSVTSLREPINKSVPTAWVLKMDSTIGVIATGAGVYKDVWSVDNRFLYEYLCDTVTVYKVDSFVNITSALEKYIYPGPRLPESHSINPSSDLLMAGYEYQHKRFSVVPGQSCKFNFLNCLGVRDGNHFITRGLIQFDFSSIPSNAIITNATISLSSAIPKGVWTHNSPTFMSNCRNYWNNDVNVSHDYFDALQYPNGDWSNMAYIKRIKNPWSPTTGFVAMNNSFTDVNRVALPSSKATNNDYSVSCTALIQDCINNPTYGLAIMQAVEDKNNCERSQTRFLSFVGNNNTKYSRPKPKIYVNYNYKQVNCRDTCVSVFSRRINPYVQGIWGNWRVNTSYTFYDDRKETDPSVATNIRRDGEFKKFVPFWYFGSPQLIASNYSRWVWNAEITKFNKKGLEIENKDPLGRFNSGLYGYNQTLPVAVAQNAKYRQIVYDGFEDYYFKTDSCDQRCPPPRHFDFTNFKSKIVDTTEKHTGKASLRLGNNESVTLTVPIVSSATDSLAGTVTRILSTRSCGPALDSITVDNNTVTPLFSPIQKDTLVFGIWVKESQACKCSSYVLNQVQITYFGSSGQIGGAVVLKPSGNIIEGWQRYEQVINIPATATSMQVSLQNTGTPNVYFDDIRFHPFNSNLKSFVYNPINLRLMAELDENNYASFYEYDDEGTLTRVKKETQRGVKTINETKSVLTTK